MHRTLALAAILAVALVVTGIAQKKEFSGTWDIDWKKATNAANMPTVTTTGRGRLVSAPTGGLMTIKQTADSFSIERPGGDGGKMITTAYKLDGVERDVTTSQGKAKARARWDGDKIVIETQRTGQDGTQVPTTLTWYAIDKDGVLWVET